MKTEVIAEVGLNHNNDLGMAAELINAAANAGARTVKFQYSTVDEEVSRTAAPEHYAELKALVPSLDFLARCKEFCEAAGVEFLCTPAGVDSLKALIDLGIKRIKVPSDNLTNVQFLRAVAKCELPVLLSTGMGASAEIMRAIQTLWQVSLPIQPFPIALLHCVSSYPCPTEQANLRAIRTLRGTWSLNCPIGFSDHTTSVVIPAAAVALGATIIEKHITLSRDLPGPDHAASLTPDDFDVMCSAIAEIEAAMGDGIKRPQLCEIENMRLYRKSLVAAQPIAKGETFTPDNITAKRPGIGVPSDQYAIWIGRTADRDYAADDLL